MVTTFGLLFRPSSDHASFRIKEKFKMMHGLMMAWTECRNW